MKSRGVHGPGRARPAKFFFGPGLGSVGPSPYPSELSGGPGRASGRGRLPAAQPVSLLGGLVGGLIGRACLRAFLYTSLFKNNEYFCNLIFV